MALGIKINVGAKDTASQILKTLARETRGMNAGFKEMAKESKKASVAMTTTMKGIEKSTKDAMKEVAKETKDINSGLKKMAGEARSAAANVASSMNSLGKAAESMKGFGSTLKKLTIGFIGFKAAQAALGKVQGFAEAFNTQEAAVTGLSKALELNGEFSDQALASHKAFASQMQEVANVGDEVTLGLMKQASMAGVSGDQLQTVTSTAIGLAEATGISLDEAMKKTISSVTGNAAALGEMIPAVRNARTEEERLAAITDVARKGLEQKKEAATTLAGVMAHARNAVGDLMEKIGELLEPILTVVYEGISIMSNVLIQLVDSMITAMGGAEKLSEILRSVMMSVVTNVVKALTFAEVIFLNFGDVIDIAMSSAKLVIIGFVEDIKHFFTVVIPEYGRWFGRNWTNLISDAFMGMVTIAKNALTNLVAMIGELMKLMLMPLKEGLEGGFANIARNIGDIAGRNLLDGFQSSTEALPEIADRALTDTERELQQRVGQMSGNLAEEFDQSFNQRMDSITSAMGLDLGELDQLKGKPVAKGLAEQAISATESRLLTRGPGQGPTVLDLLQDIKKSNDQIVENTYDDVEPAPPDADRLVVEMAGGAA